MNAGGVSVAGSLSDAEVLASYGMLRRTFSGILAVFSVMPRGIQHYQEIKQRAPAVNTVEDAIQRFLTAPEFKLSHAVAYSKWEQACKALWGAESTEQLTTIGHLCREAMQEFASSLAVQHHIDVSQIKPEKTVDRLRSILKSRGRLGDTEAAFLDAVIPYWGVVSDLVQRQEHGGLREREPVTWEDARRVVFQTCVVMFELSRSLNR